MNKKMSNRKRSFILTLIIFLVLIIASVKLNNSDFENYDQTTGATTIPSANLEGVENILVSDIDRFANITKYGLVRIEDNLEFKNLDNNPVTSVFIGIPLSISDKLVYLKSTGDAGDTLFIDRSYLVMNEFEMIKIYFNSPLLPYQTEKIQVIHSYKNLLEYVLNPATTSQEVTFKGLVYPALPYKAKGEIETMFFVPDNSENIEGGWGFENPSLFFIRYNFNFLSGTIGDDFILPFMENLNEDKLIQITFNNLAYTKIEISEINREIFVSPWSIIKVNDEIVIENKGAIDFTVFSLDLPSVATGIYVSDDIGEILGVSVTAISDAKQVEINLLSNRARLLPNSSFRLKLRYYLPFEQYYSANWLQESIQFDIFSTTYDFLGHQQNIKIIIDGCYNVDYISSPPDFIMRSHGTTTLIYTSTYVLPEETKIIQFTFTIDLFDLLLRPIIIILLIALVASIYVLRLKTTKKDREEVLLKQEFIPVNEIREFCSLHEEKNALILEIRQAEEDAKRKKIAKKNLKNIVGKNNSKIDEIQQELIPFKKILIESGEAFENIVKRLDVLEVERLSIKDSLNLLESRYKRGRLPSRAAYIKLSDDFKKRRKKIDRTIDKFIQQLRSYLF
jgi:hypothetical protein